MFVALELQGNFEIMISMFMEFWECENSVDILGHYNMEATRGLGMFSLMSKDTLPWFPS